MTFSVFIMLCNHQLCLVPELSHHPKKKSHTHQAASPHSPLLLAPDNV